ncbi:unnamed protein product [Cladocopium goreaui]|uniref:Uncharacterized protein n=1 Tax=Cladocopium goreaui TaxID=2562237 RepID=A0A9P1G062_9DINO|nr:unnamed protein product [Cladocopium goreaui]
MALVEKPRERATLPAHVAFATRRPRTEGSPRVPRVLLEQRLAPLTPEPVKPVKGQGRQHAWSLDAAALPLPSPRPAVASSAPPAPERRKLEPLRTRRWRCRSQDMTDPQDSPLKGRLQRALAQRRASEEVQSARKGTVREHKRKATTQIDLIEGRPVTKSEREKWDSAFARYQLDGEIHVDELKGALVMCPSDLRHWEQLGAGVAEHPAGEAEHTSKRMQLQMPGRAASPLKQMEVNPVTYGSRWNPFPPANSGSPKPKSKGH